MFIDKLGHSYIIFSDHLTPRKNELDKSFSSNGSELLWSFETSSYKPEVSLSSEANNNKVDLYIRKSTTQSQPYGIVVSVVGSIWLPIPPVMFFTYSEMRIDDMRFVN